MYLICTLLKLIFWSIFLSFDKSVCMWVLLKFSDEKLTSEFISAADNKILLHMKYTFSIPCVALCCKSLIRRGLFLYLMSNYSQRSCHIKAIFSNDVYKEFHRSCPHARHFEEEWENWSWINLEVTKLGWMSGRGSSV